jgi:type IV pilus assembly protein PilQ
VIKLKNRQDMNVLKFRSKSLRLLIGLVTILSTSLFVQAVPKASNVVDSLSVKDTESQTTVRVDSQKEPTFTVFTLKNPTRVFVDISNARMGEIAADTQVRNGVVRSVSVTAITDATVEMVRVIMELEIDALYSVKSVDRAIVISVDNSERQEKAIVVESTESVNARSLAQSAKKRAEQAERRAQTAEKRARDTELALVEARARASENAKQATSLRVETQSLKQSQGQRLQAANDRAAQAEVRLSKMQNDVRERVAKAQRQAEEAFQRADRAEDRSEKQIAQAEAVARREEANAMTSAAQAAVRSKRLESRAVTAEQRAQTAESELLGIKRRLNSLSAEVSAKASSDLEKAKAEVDRYRAEAVLVKKQAVAAEQAVNQKVAVYEARASEAELRAKRSQQAEVKGEQTAKDLATSLERVEALSAVASNAEQRATEAVERLKATRTELSSLRAQRENEQVRAQSALAQAEANAQRAEATALRRAADADVRLAQADSALKSAKTQSAQEIAEAKAKAVRMEADLRRAEARSQSAKTRAAKAERLALEAAANTRKLNARAEAAQKKVESLQTALVGAQNREAVQLAQTQATVESVALEKAQLAEKLRRAELDQAQSRARIESLMVANQNAATQAETALQATERQQRAAKDAERRARDAELAIEKSRLVQLELERRSTALESQLATVKAERERLKNEDLRAERPQREDVLKAMGRIETLEVQLRAEALASKKASAAITRSQTALNDAKQEALDAQTKLAQADEKVRKAELRTLTETQRAETAEAQATQNLERAQSASVKLAEVSESAQAAQAAAIRAEEKARLAEADAQNARLEIDKAREKAEFAERQRAQAMTDLTESERRAQEAEALLNQRPEPEASPAPPAPERLIPVERATPELPAKEISTALPPAPQLRLSRISDIGFSNSGTHSVIRIESSSPVIWSVRGDGLSTQTLVLSSTEILPILERTLDTSDFGGNVNLVSSFQAPSTPNEVHVVVTMANPLAGEIVQTGNVIEWQFVRMASDAGNRVASLPAPAWQGPVRSMQADPSRVAPYTGLNQLAGPSTRSGPRGKKRYRGRKINVDIKDGDIHNVLRVLAKTGNVNIVTSDEVSGTVTMHLKLVPWDQALDMVLRTKGLDMVREGDIIRVAPSEMIAQEREAELKKQEVRERLKPLEIKMITVNHASAEDLIPRIKSVLSKRGNAEFDNRTNTVIVKDVDDHLDAAEDMIRRLDTQTPQVLIETRIVEVNEVNVKQLGIQWGMDSVWSAATGNPTGLRFPSSIGISGGADDQQTITEGVSSNPNFVVNLPSSAGGGSGGALGLSFGSIDSTFNLNVRLSALENRGSVKIVSSPKITTLDNKTARISQGVSIPISQVSATGV